MVAIFEDLGISCTGYEFLKVNITSTYVLAGLSTAPNFYILWHFTGHIYCGDLIFEAKGPIRSGTGLDYEQANYAYCGGFENDERTGEGICINLLRGESY